MERNHQVQQMGEIYARATDVISWLGTNPALVALLAAVIHWGCDWLSAFSGWGSCDQEDVVESVKGLVQDPYWTRAWIAQEVLLAKKVIVQAKDQTLDLSVLNMIIVPELHRFERLSFALVELAVRFSSSQSTKKANGLIELANNLCESQCSIPRDRIFSLLSLSSEGEELRVDYDMPEAELIVDLIRICRDTACFCSVSIVSYCLRSEGLQASPPTQEYLLEFEIENSPTIGSLDFPRCQFCRSRVNPASVQPNTDLFCLTTICRWMRGHLSLEHSTGNVFYEYFYNVHVDMGTSFDNEYSKRSILCANGDGIIVSSIPDSSSFTLRLTLSTIAEVISRRIQDMAAKIYVCPNFRRGRTRTMPCKVLKNP